MGDIEGARSTLEEVMVEGNDDHRGSGSAVASDRLRIYRFPVIKAGLSGLFLCIKRTHTHEIAACIEYDGTPFYGWQRLSHGLNGTSTRGTSLVAGGGGTD